MKLRAMMIVTMLGLAMASRAAAQATTQASEQVAISTGIEEGKRVLKAVVTVDGKPLQDAKVRIGIQRTFGVLWLGEDTTIDDGSVAVPFPHNLPGDAAGNLQAVVQVEEPTQFAALAHTALRGGIIVPPDLDPFPRALWSRTAPVPLLVTIFGLLTGVWITYGFVIRQVFAIAKGARS